MTQALENPIYHDPSSPHPHQSSLWLPSGKPRYGSSYGTRGPTGTISACTQRAYVRRTSCLLGQAGHAAAPSGSCRQVGSPSSSRPAAKGPQIIGTRSTSHMACGRLPVITAPGGPKPVGYDVFAPVVEGQRREGSETVVTIKLMRSKSKSLLCPAPRNVASPQTAAAKKPGKHESLTIASSRQKPHRPLPASPRLPRLRAPPMRRGPRHGVGGASAGPTRALTGSTGLDRDGHK